MHVLIVEGDDALAALWRSHIERNGARVSHARDQEQAVKVLQHDRVDVIILDLEPESGSAIAIADFAAYRHPQTQIVPVTKTNFFSDGSVFQHLPNVCSYQSAGAPPEDLAAIVDHYGPRG
ncbi:Response regulator receiver domain-containing protein [Tranquillimonas rosea]|uniref:Response regulator receiver domain-containing protein n=1 Tax=Tranquillimonas rosea TaxID=641238 RepID=A0A1H9W6G9_9RHOB|nr:response regulator [Tranquillimonas rosea]SES29267.1 Response regulator receiver domain-containing protein [Tranquillimonas rosea]